MKYHAKKDQEAVDTFKKTPITSAKKVSKRGKVNKKINLYFQDESRFVLFTRNGKFIKKNTLSRTYESVFLL